MATSMRLSAVNEDLVPLSPSVGGSTRVDSRLSGRSSLIFEPSNASFKPKYRPAAQYPNLLVDPAHELTDLRTSPSRTQPPRSPNVSTTAVIDPPTAPNRAQSARSSNTSTSTDLESEAPPTASDSFEQVVSLAKLYRQPLIYASIGGVQVIQLVVAYYEAPLGSREPNVLWLHIISTESFIALLIDQVMELVNARGRRNKKNLTAIYTFSVTLVGLMTIAAWTLWGMGTTHHNIRLQLLAAILFKGIDILFVLLLAARCSCVTTQQILRMIKKRSQAPPEMNPENGPYGEYLRESNGVHEMV